MEQITKLGPATQSKSRISPFNWPMRDLSCCTDAILNDLGWAYVRLLRKDGTPSDRETCFYRDWKHVGCKAQA